MDKGVELAESRGGSVRTSIAQSGCTKRERCARKSLSRQSMSSGVLGGREQNNSTDLGLSP